MRNYTALTVTGLIYEFFGSCHCIDCTAVVIEVKPLKILKNNTGGNPVCPFVTQNMGMGIRGHMDKTKFYHVWVF